MAEGHEADVHTIANDLREPSHRRVPSRRATLIGLSFVAVLAWLTPYNDSVLRNTYLAGTNFPLAPFGIMLLLAVPVNFVLARLRPGVLRPFTAAELMTIWAVMLIASGIPSSGLLRMLVPQIAGYRYGATHENLWEERLSPHLRSYMVILDEDPATEFFTGMPDGPPMPGIPGSLSISRWHHIPWRAWRDPLLGYSVLTFGTFLGFLCLVSILRRQWVERERYPYPLVQVPLEIAEASEAHRGLPPLFRNPLFLGTATLVLVLHTHAGLCRLYPHLGRFTFAIDLAAILTEPPWRYLEGSMKYLRVYPLAIGLTHGVNTEVLLSVWAIKVLIGMQQMWFGSRGEYGGEVAFGWDPAYQCYPQLAAYLALSGWILWMARDHLRTVFRCAFSRCPVDDSDEPMRYRTAAWGFVLSVAVLMGWFLYSGVRFPVALVVVLVYFAIATGCTWLVCQGGQMLVAARTVPSDTLVGLFGKTFRLSWGGSTVLQFDSVTPRELAVLPIFESPFGKDLREILMPNAANLTQAADAGVDRRRLLILGAVAIVLSIAVASPRKVALGYEYGAATLPDTWGFRTAATLPFDWPAQFMVRDFPTNTTNILYFLEGAAFVLGCLVLRSKFLWFRFHPGGLLIAASFAGDVFWFSMFLAWAIKSVILYLGGARLLRSAKPFYYGLVIGDTISWVIWMVVGLAIQDETRTYPLMPT